MHLGMENKLSVEQVGVSMRMSNRLGGLGKRGHVRVWASVKQRPDSRICRTERGTFYKEHRGELESDFIAPIQRLLGHLR